MGSIPPSAWASFCDAFSREHLGWLVSIAIVEPTAQGVPQVRPLLHERPFRGITYERHGGHDGLCLLLGDGGAHQEHRIERVRRIDEQQAEGGGHRGLRITAASGEITELRFRAAAAPETLDGLAATER